MARSIHISEKAAQVIAAGFAATAEIRDVEMRRAVGELREALYRAAASGLRQAGRKAPRNAFDHAVNARLSKPRRPTKAETRDETAAIREACVRRAGAFCECGCGGPLALSEHCTSSFRLAATPELDHFFGRGKGRPSQSVETCWILRADCHREKTNNRPDAATWLRKFITHCERRMATTDDLGRGWALYFALCEARRRLAFVETRSALPAAPRSRT